MGSLFAALGLVFVAELGDKTQLVALGFGARHRIGPVMVGVAIAYALTNLLSVVVGGLLGVALPERAIGVVGGLMFLGFAARALLSDDEDEDDEDELALDHRSIVVSVASAMFIAELGDKTMLATTTLAADGSPVPVWIGATIGIILSGALGVVLGRAFGARLPERATRIGSAVLFAVFGAVLLITSL